MLNEIVWPLLLEEKGRPAFGDESKGATVRLNPFSRGKGGPDNLKPHLL